MSVSRGSSYPQIAQLSEPCRPSSRPATWSKTLTLNLTASVLALAAAQAQGFELKFDDTSWEGYIDTTFTASAAMRVQGADPKGTPVVVGPGNISNAGYVTQATGNQTVFRDAGDIYSSPLSLLTEIGLKKDNYGFFSRLTYTYDYTIMQKDCTNCAAPVGAPSVAAIAAGVPLPNRIADDAQTTAGNKFRVLVLFVYADWEMGDHPFNVRVGKQVVNWGDSNIIPGGISQMQNPIDLGKTTVPGVEIKEVLMPQEMIYSSFGITGNVTVEAYYVWNWRESIFFPVGTLFSPFDFIGTGYNPALAPIPNGSYAGRDEPDGGQWGLALHTIIDSLNEADLGFYWVRSHSFIPYLGVNPAKGGYQWIYTENQDTYAVSLSGEIPGDLGLSFQTELNFRPNFYDTRECQNPGFGLVPIPGRSVISPTSGSRVFAGCDVGAGDAWTWIGNLTRSVGTDLLGADKLTLVLDVQVQKIDGLHSNDPTDRLQSNSPIDRGNFPGVDALNRAMTDFSWGYVVVANLEYNNAFANINMTPQVVFVHNVDGYEPFATGGLVEEQKSLRTSLLFTYLASTSFELAYDKRIGAAGINEDKDNISAIFKYSF
jgi:hypothetical protein